jgi:hypothetical protein
MDTRTVPHPRREQLQTLRDEIRVKMHLAEMDAKDRWHRLEPKVDRLLDRVEDATEHAIAKMIRELQSLSDSLL